jgi:hypothetical protein
MTTFRPAAKVALSIAALLALAATALAYLNPDLAVTLATRLWQCF